MLDRYARVTFEKTLIAGQPQAELLAPGHPLLDAVVDVVLERFQPLAWARRVLVDETDEGMEPRLLVYLEHAIRDGRTGRSGEPRVISQRLQFIHLKEDGTAVDGGPAPYLDYRPITAEERSARRGRDHRALAVAGSRGSRARLRDRQPRARSISPR